VGEAMSAQDPIGILHSFHQAAKTRNLDYLLIGGFAASYWGRPRFTADVDFVCERGSIERIKEVCSGLGYSLVFLHPKQSFAHFKKPDGSDVRMDFMLVDESTWQKLHTDARTADMGGTEPIPIVSPLHLIAMKLHGAKQTDREDPYKDLNDIAEILHAQNLRFEDLEGAGIIKKHGTEETVAQLRQILAARRKRP
jgi:hypothetical protein